jgi:hypothetical protein
MWADSGHITRTVRAWRVAFFVLFSACEPRVPSVLFHEYPNGVALTLEEAVSDPQFRHVESYGFEERDGFWFGQIVDIAVNTSGVVAVADVQRCSITLFTAGTPGHRVVGGCGSGPAEFQAVGFISFLGDDLIVADEGSRQLVVIDTMGIEVRRIQPDVLSGRVPRLASIAAFDDTTLLVGLNRLPEPGLREPPFMLALVDARSGRTVREWMRDTPIGARSTRNFLRGIRACTNSSVRASRLVVANSWTPQVLTFDVESSHVPVQNIIYDIPGLQPALREGTETEWRPPTPGPGLACGESIYVVVHKRPAGQVARHVSEGSILIAGYDGAPLLAARLTNAGAMDSVLLTVPAAVYGDRVFTYSNSLFGQPIIREYQFDLLKAHEQSHLFK